MSLEQLAESAAKRFTQCFSQPPRWIVAAPGRVNLIGEHTDYNDGFVLPMAIDRFTVIAGGRQSEHRAVVHSDTLGETATISLRSLQRGDPAWANYIRGVVAGFQARGVNVGGFNAAIDSSVPIGGGLSSSAALEVATAVLLELMTGHTLDPIEKALLCQKAEHEYAGVPCGIMDQFTSVLAQPGQLLLLDCRSRKTELVPMNDPSVTILTINTNVRHRHASGEYAQRRAQCEEAAHHLGVPALRDADLNALKKAQNRLDPLIYRRAHHVVTENARTLDAVRAFAAYDWRTAGRLMYASHASLRDDYEVSCRELDIVVEIAQGIGQKGGVFGCRMTGGGFGGCAVSLIKTDAVQTVTRKFSQDYENQTGVQPIIFACRPAGGARVLKGESKPSHHSTPEGNPKATKGRL
jgi:galactokinase